MPAAAKSLQSCPALCDPIDRSPPGSPIPGILKARTLEWVAISFSNAWKWRVKMKSLSRVRLLATPQISVLASAKSDQVLFSKICQGSCWYSESKTKKILTRIIRLYTHNPALFLITLLCIYTSFPHGAWICQAYCCLHTARHTHLPDRYLHGSFTDLLQVLFQILSLSKACPKTLHLQLFPPIVFYLFFFGCTFHIYFSTTCF